MVRCCDWTALSASLNPIGSISFRLVWLERNHARWWLVPNFRKKNLKEKSLQTKHKTIKSIELKSIYPPNYDGPVGLPTIMMDLESGPVHDDVDALDDRWLKAMRSDRISRRNGPIKKFITSASTLVVSGRRLVSCEGYCSWLETKHQRTGLDCTASAKCSQPGRLFPSTGLDE